MQVTKVSLMILMPVALTGQISRVHDAVSLKPWPAPLYWQPTAAESRGNAARPDAVPHAELPANSLVFVGMTPCRLVDTRSDQGFTGPFGPPSLAGQASRTFPIQSSTTCTIPAIAQAYSFNITVVPPGFLGYITVYPTGATRPIASTIDDNSGIILANAAIVAAGTGGSVDVFANNPTDIIIDINGYYAPQTGITLAQGSAGAPSLSFSGDSGTGIFSSGTGALSLATGGTSRVTLDSTGHLTVAGPVLAGSGESHFFEGTYRDPTPNAAAAMKVTGLLAVKGSVTVVDDTGEIFPLPQHFYPLEVAGLAALGGQGANLGPGTAGAQYLSYLANTGQVLVGWNQSGGDGETNLISNRGPGGVGGFEFLDMGNNLTAQCLMRMRGDNGYVGIGRCDLATQPLQMASGAYVSTGGVWTNASDRNLKENFAPVVPAEILEKIDRLPASEWNYKNEGPAVKHIGPVAQDFWSLFHLGNSSSTISSIDPAGIALVGIQGLDEKIRLLEEQNRHQSEQIAALQKTLQTLLSGKVSTAAANQE